MAGGEDIKKPKNRVFVFGEQDKNLKGVSQETIQKIRDALIHTRVPRDYKSPTQEDYEREAFQIVIGGDFTKVGILGIRAEILKMRHDPMGAAIAKVRGELGL